MVIDLILWIFRHKQSMLWGNDAAVLLLFRFKFDSGYELRNVGLRQGACTQTSTTCHDIIDELNTYFETADPESPFKIDIQECTYHSHWVFMKISSAFCCQSSCLIAPPALGPISYKYLPYGLVFKRDKSSGCALGSIHNRTKRYQYYAYHKLSNDSSGHGWILQITLIILALLTNLPIERLFTSSRSDWYW